MKKERMKILIQNLVTYVDSELMESLSLEDKLNLLKEQIGLTNDEIDELELVDESLKIF